MRVSGASDRRNSRQNDERTQKQEKRGSGQLRQAACFAICLVSAEIGVHRLQSIAPEVNGDFFPGQLPCIVCSGVEIGACGSTAFLQAEIKLSESLFDDPRF